MGPNGQDAARLELQIVVGSTRPGRAADLFLPWLLDRAERHGRFSVQLLDLRDWDLPMFAEPTQLMMSGRFSTPVVQRWNEVMAAGDAYLFVFPEYNHSVPGVLKNAVDHALGARLRNKPAGFLGYSGGPIGGARAVEHMVGITVEREMAPLRNAVLLGGVGRGFDSEGLPVDPMTDHALAILLDDLAWWGEALRRARADGELSPPRQRPVQPSAGALLRRQPAQDGG
ncbi:MAG TPA: NADPH-dependent FMN reductase [Acidimicrobiia bacterium]|nr:NADPH-dependent FMN reductase [Acidimicrobiia bacterium]